MCDDFSNQPFRASELPAVRLEHTPFTAAEKAQLPQTNNHYLAARFALKKRRADAEKAQLLQTIGRYLAARLLDRRLS